VHCHGYRANMFGLVIAKLCGIPAITTCHGFIRNDRRLRFYNALDTKMQGLFSRVIAVSARMRDDLVAGGLDPARVEVITNAVAEVPPEHQARQRQETRRSLGIGDDELVFGYVGRLSIEKGPDNLVRAAQLLRTRGVRARYVVIGDGPERRALESAATELGLADDITFAGFQLETGPWYSAMDAFVLPSLTEGTPVALLEAMAHGLAVVATAVGGVPAVISHLENGVLVEPGSVEALATAMGDVAGGADLRAALGARARQTIARTYGIRDWIARTVAVYGSVAGRRPSQAVREEPVASA